MSDESDENDRVTLEKGVPNKKNSDISDISDEPLVGDNKNNNINNNIDTPPVNVTPALSSLMSPEITFDDDAERILHPAVGMIKYVNCKGIEKEVYYFGINMNMIVTKHRNEGSKKKPVMVSYQEKEKRPVFLVSYNDKNDKRFFHIEDFEEIGFKIKTDLLMQKSPWKIEDIKKYMIDDYTLLKDLPIDLFNDIKKEFEKYIDFPEEEAYDFFPLWIIGTYFFELFFSFPYIHLHGLKNTAKSKVMQLCSKMTFNSEYIGSITNAVLFRLVSQNKPTLYIDEYELQPKAEQAKEDKDIETLLNNGYKKGMEVARMEQQDKKWIVKKFDVYCPKMIANISGLTGALPSRCIKFVMHRAKPNDIRGSKYPDKDIDNIWENIRSRLYIFALENWKAIGFYYNQLEKEKIEGINNRNYELWRPILSIASLVGKDCYGKMVEYAKKKCQEGKMDEDLDDDWDTKLIEVLVRYINEERFYYVKEITEELDKEFIERIDNFGGVEKPIYKKTKPSTHWVGRTLKKFSFLNHKKDNKGHKYYLSKKLVYELVSRLQIAGIDVPIETQKQIEENVN